MWAGGHVMTTACPVSLISAQSVSLLEEFSAQKTLGARLSIHQTRAKVIDAFQILEGELLAERIHDEQ